MANSTAHPSFDDPNSYVLYRYHPSLAAAVVFIVLFLLTTLFHIFQLVRTRTWYFIPMIVGGVFEFIGYIGRAQSSHDQWKLGPYIQQSILLLVAPALFAASIYMILGRIILLVEGEKHSMIRKTWLTKIFVTGDVLSFLIQSGGGGLMASDSLSSLHTGEKLVVVGLFVQIGFFGFFIITAIIFQRRMLASPTPKSSDPALPWQRHLNVLYIASVFIMIRSVFRVVEYLMGNNGFLLKHELFLYIFDAMLMCAVMAIFNVVHPSEITAMLHDRKREDGTDLDPNMQA